MRSPILLLPLLVCLVVSSADAKRLKIYSHPKAISPGQLAVIRFENPDPEKPLSQSKCTAERLTSWVKSEIPILRIEQNGKQLWMELGSYQSFGDSCIATFMAPTNLDPGAASLFLVHGRDASIPYAFTVNTDYETRLFRLQGLALVPLAQFKLIGEGFVPTDILSTDAAVKELEHNVSFTTLDRADQYTRLNKRMASDWARVPRGNFLTISQSGKSWTLYVEQCSITPRGMALDFTAPPDLKKGPATLVLTIRNEGKEVGKTPPLEVEVD
jgi:hypothetical protein